VYWQRLLSRFTYIQERNRPALDLKSAVFGQGVVWRGRNTSIFSQTHLGSFQRELTSLKSGGSLEHGL
jgi:hypothetical protein